MNEAETRAELIDPKLRESGWGTIEGSKVLREHHITLGRLQVGSHRAKPMIADYVLVYNGQKLAVIEAKSDVLEVGEGVAQAKLYAEKMQIETTFSTNGREIYQICMVSGIEELISKFPTPQELWYKTFGKVSQWRQNFNDVPYEDVGGTKAVRFYQEIAINEVTKAIAEGKQRILLTLATGTGKTFIAFQIAWKLFQTRWNLKRDASRRPRILFLADRNILANQAYNAFSAFPADALVRIKPSEIAKTGSVPTNGSIFFTIFQTFMSGTDSEGKSTPYFGEYPKDYFDFIIIDECHRGGANDESNWRGILEYFAPAVQLGLTATPKRKDNVDTYRYFGEPVYTYSLKEGINDGFLTPFKVKRIKTTLDDYIYTSDDNLIEGDIEEGKIYRENEFNKKIEIRERETKRVKVFLDEADPHEKSIVFCANQDHAALIRELINQHSRVNDPHYCVRVTANDGEIGEQFLRDFQDNERSIPTILTTSQKLSTGVDARNIRNIVLLRPINSMIEFKQIIGRGTRLFEGKDFFTIYDFVDAHHHFMDPEWDGEPLDPGPYVPKKLTTPSNEPGPLTNPGGEGREPIRKIKVRLRDGKEREIQHTIATSFWSADGKPISVEEFLQSLYGTLPSFFKSEAELRKLWSNPITRKTLLDKLSDAGYGRDQLIALQKLIDAEKCDLFDVLEYVSYAFVPVTRAVRAATAKSSLNSSINATQIDFIDFVLSKYVETGVEELEQEKLPILLTTKYHSLEDAKDILGDVASISHLFIDFQKHLYQQRANL